MARGAREMRLAAGEVVCTQGEKLTELYMLVKGTIESVIKDEDESKQPASTKRITTSPP